MLFSAVLCLVASAPGLLARPAMPDVSTFGDMISYPFDQDDDFVRDWQRVGGVWMTEHGELLGGDQLDVTPAGAKTVLRQAIQWAQYRYEAKLLVRAGWGRDEDANAGVLFGATHLALGADAYRGFYFGLNVNTSSVVLGKAEDGSWTLLQQTNDTALRADTQYDVEVTCGEETIIGAINGVTYVNYTDPKAGITCEGHVGYRAFLTSLRGDDVLVTRIP